LRRLLVVIGFLTTFGGLVTTTVLVTWLNVILEANNEKDYIGSCFITYFNTRLG